MPDHSNLLTEPFLKLSFEKRVLEPAVMEETAADYTQMDFSATNQAFVALISALIPQHSYVCVCQMKSDPDDQ